MRKTGPARNVRAANARRRIRAAARNRSRRGTRAPQSTTRARPRAQKRECTRLARRPHTSATEAGCLGRANADPTIRRKRAATVARDFATTATPSLAERRARFAPPAAAKPRPRTRSRAARTRPPPLGGRADRLRRGRYSALAWFGSGESRVQREPEGQQHGRERQDHA